MSVDAGDEAAAAHRICDRRVGMNVGGRLATGFIPSRSGRRHRRRSVTFACSVPENVIGVPLPSPPPSAATGSPFACHTDWRRLTAAAAAASIAGVE